MAIYHLTVKNGSKSKGHSGAEKQAYIERIGKYAKRGDLVYSSSGNLPSFANHDNRLFWLAVDNYERANATVYKEIEFSLPKELSTEQQIELATSFAKNITDKHNLPYTFAIHSGIDKGTGKINNPHCHLVFNERITDNINRDAFTHFRRANNKEPEKGGAKKLDLSKKDWLKQVRADWQEFANNKLQENEINERIDHRTLKAQGILREPQIHLGKTASYLLREKSKKNARVNRYILIDRLNNEIGELENELNREIKTSENDRRISPGNQTTSASFSDSDRRLYEHQSRIEKLCTRSIGQQPTISEKLQSNNDEYERRYEGNKQSFILANENQVANHINNNIDNNYSNHLHDVMAILSSKPNSTDSSSQNRNTERRQPMDTNNQTNKKINLKNDRTLQVIFKQIKAMNCDLVTIGIKSDKGMIQKDWTLNEVLANTDWLKKENAKGSDVYIRPAGDKNIGLILLDDLNQAQLAKLKQSGYDPCIVTQTSPYNYQAWVRVSNEPLNNEIATLISKNLAKNFDADPNSADWRHYGRLAGFTNRKPQHKNELGQSPFVLLHSANQKNAENGQNIINKAEIYLEQQKLQLEQKNRLNAILEPIKISFGAEKEYKRQAKYLLDKYGTKTNLSRLDGMVIKSIALTGKYSANTLIEILEKHSPNIEDKKSGHIQDYAIRTVTKIMELPDIMQAREQYLEREKNINKGYDINL